MNEDEYPRGEKDYSYIPINKEELSQRIKEHDSIPLLLWGSKTKMSLAGAQDKTALYYKNGEFFLPEKGAPSNVILKAGFDDYTINEFITTKIASFLGLSVPNIEIIDLVGKPAFLSYRFDRMDINGEIVRLHQEDMCQALGILPENKYEEYGGPSIKTISNLILDKTTSSLIFLESFPKAIIFDVILGNCDAHGKNFALLYNLDSTIELSPFYDLVSTTIYPNLDTKLAMKINNVKDINHVFREDILNLSIVGRKRLESILDNMLSSLDSAFSTVEETLPQYCLDTFTLIKQGTLNRVKNLS